MDKELFDQLHQSMKEAVAITKGEIQPSRVVTVRPPDVNRNTGNYDEYHLEWLKNPANAAAFLNSVMEEYDRDAFVQALRDVACAQGGTKVINTSLSKRDSLKFSSITELLHDMGLRLTVVPDQPATREA
jgi:DNA-binding phage protein